VSTVTLVSGVRIGHIPWRSITKHPHLVSLVFVTGRVIIGLGLASFLLTSLAVVQEITHPRNRVTMAHSWDSYWILGSVFANWVVFGTSWLTSSWSWRIPYLIQVPMAVYVSCQGGPRR
jgi:MFS family permease